MSASRSWRPAAQHHCPAAADLPHRKHLHSMIRILLRSSLVTKEVTSSPARGTSHPRLSLFTLASRWPILLLLLALLLSAGSVVGLTRLHPDARVDLLIDPNAAAFQDQALSADTFGADPVVVMAKPAAGSTLITPEHIVGLSHLEGKLHLAAGVKKVYGPGTLVNTLAISTTTILLKACADEGKAAEATARQQAVAAGKSSAQQDQAAQQAFQQAVSACAQRYAKAFPSLGVPAVNNPTFIQGVLLEPDGQHVRPFWSWALPDMQHAVITVRLNRNASLEQVRHVIDIVNGASSSGDLKELHDLQFVASGSPALTLSVADSIFRSLALLLPLALIAVLVVALLALGASMVLTILVAALAALWTAGIAGYLGLPVTPATLVVLPVVLGLSADYLIQSANRVMESAGSMEERLTLAARRILPTTGLASAAAFRGSSTVAASARRRGVASPGSGHWRRRPPLRSWSSAWPGGPRYPRSRSKPIRLSWCPQTTPRSRRRRRCAKRSGSPGRSTCSSRAPTLLLRRP